MTDRIRVGVSGNAKVEDIFRRNEAAIASQTLAKEVLYGTCGEGAKEWNLNGETVTLSVSRI